MKAAQKMMSNMSPEDMNRMMEVGGLPCREARGAEAAEHPDGPTRTAASREA